MFELEQYQLFDALRPEEYKALEQDIRKRGVLVPIELDDDGNILDGHNRVEIAKKHGLRYESIVRRFANEEQKREHIIKLNLCRRHLDPWQWGQAFKKLLEVRGVKLGRGANQGNFRQELPKVCEEVGVPERTARHRMRQAEQYEQLGPDEKKAVDLGEKTPGKALKERKLEERRAQAEEIRRQPPPKSKAGTKYEVIVVDPPWQYEKRAEDVTHRARLPYPSMTAEEICEWGKDLPVAKDCILWLWTTNAFMRDAFTVLDAWGFAEKTILTWFKDKMGVGDWLRGKTEHCILAVKGRPLVRLTTQTTVLVADVGKHSEKPDEFIDLVDALCPSRVRAEYFSRKQREGWHCYGDEITTLP